MIITFRAMDKHLGFIIPLAATGKRIQVRLCKVILLEFMVIF